MNAGTMLVSVIVALFAFPVMAQQEQQRLHKDLKKICNPPTSVWPRDGKQTVRHQENLDEWIQQFVGDACG